MCCDLIDRGQGHGSIGRVFTHHAQSSEFPMHTLGLVVYTYNSSTPGGETRGQKFKVILSTN